MIEIVGMGVVGAGAIGLRGALSHLTSPDVQDRVRVVAVCDPAPGRAEAAGQKYDVPAVNYPMGSSLTAAVTARR